MAKIIIVALWTGAIFWLRWFHLSYYVAVRKENCNHLGPDWQGPPTVKDIVLSDIRFFFFDWHPASIQTIGDSGLFGLETRVR